MTDKEEASAPIFRIDQAAALKGGEVAGQYLDGIGKFDLSQLSAEEWAAFCMKLVGGACLAAIGDVYGDQVPF